jgi:acetolactate synthase-1/2/3 large subunit
VSDTGARIIDALVAGGVDAIFGVPGGQTLPLYRAARATGFRHVLMRDERTAACAADAYARVSGRVGVCDATVGPGATNLVSGLAEAYSSSIPVLAIVADVRTDQGHLRQRGVVSQAIDQRAFLQPVTKWVARVERADVFDDVFQHALRVATTGRPGPVALEIPDDVFAAEVPARRPQIDARSTCVPRHRPAPAAADVERLGRLLLDAERPLILAGGGVLLSDAGHALTDLAHTSGIPVATTIMGKGSIDERDELAVGVVGTFGRIRAGRALSGADVVLVVGSKLDQLSTYGFRLPSPAQRIAHIDIDGEEIGRVTPVELGVVADAGEALRALGDWWRENGKPARGTWIASLPHDAARITPVSDPRVAPEEVVATVSARMTADDVFVSDASLSSGWSARCFEVKRHGRTYLSPRGLAGIGWAGGAAIGAQVASSSGTRVVALAGDGAWGYTLAEIETAARLDLPITYVVLNNASYGWIAHTEDQLEMTELSRLSEADYALAGRAMGARSARVKSIDEFRDAFAEAYEASTTTVIEVLSSPDASPTVRLRDLKGAPRTDTSAPSADEGAGSPYR